MAKPINMDELVKGVVKSKIPVDYQDVEDTSVDEQELTDEQIHTGIFDLSNPDLYNPGKIKYKKNKNGKTGGYSFVSIYMKDEEKEHLKKLAAKYHLSLAAVVRMLIVNSK